jgi:DNA primase
VDRATLGFTEVRRAAGAVACEIERRAPDLATAKLWKEQRHGVFVDYMNAKERGGTRRRQISGAGRPPHAHMAHSCHPASTSP